MDERRDFQDKQYAFAAHLRDPENALAPPGIEDRRMAVYRDLFFNNLSSLLSTFFPVLRKIHSDKHWRRFIREFMKVHRAKTPYFLELPEEFLTFLQQGYAATEDDFPFLTELAHYEYIELALSVSTAANDAAGVEPDGDLLAGTPVRSTLAWSFAYHYPVHRISTSYLPDTAAEQPVYLSVYRRADDSVHFLELNAASAALLDALESDSDGLSGEALLRRLAAEVGYPDVDAFVRHGETTLNELRRLEIICGARPVT